MTDKQPIRCAENFIKDSPVIDLQKLEQDSNTQGVGIQFAENQFV